MIATRQPALHVGDRARKSAHDSNSSAKDLLLVEVPTPIFLGHPASQRRGLWQGTFDIAVWLRTPLGVRAPLQLMLKYWDDNGARASVLDRCYIGGHRTVLLNASFSLTITGQVRRAGLYLKSAPRPSAVYLEEWHLIPQERKIAGVK